MLAYSVALVLVMIFRPQGIFGSWEFSLSRVLRRLFGGGTGPGQGPAGHAVLSTTLFEPKPKAAGAASDDAGEPARVDAAKTGGDPGPKAAPGAATLRGEVRA